MSERIPDSRYDVVVAGARCAGASTALLLARAGLRVLVVDPVARGRDVTSTHALMRGAVLQLHRWGLLDRIREAGTPPIRTTTFDYPDERISIPIQSKGGVDALAAPRRTVLDPVLVRAAEDAGAEVIHGLRVEELVRDRRGRVSGARLVGRHREHVVAAGWVVGADGIHSAVARMAGARHIHRARHATASIYGYWTGLPLDEFRWLFRPGAGAGLIPTNDGAVCVFVSVPPGDLQRAGRQGLEALFRTTLKRMDPGLESRLTPGRARGWLRGFGGVPGFLRKPYGRGWALVGDAGYFKDPLTAHGITDALRDAELLARAVASGGDGSLRDYQAARDSVAREFMDVTDAIASLSWSTGEVKALHHRLSKAMNVGSDMVQSWEGEDGVSSAYSRIQTRNIPAGTRSS